MDVDVDTVLTTLGPWNRYQLIQLAYVGLLHMLGPCHAVLIYVFIGYRPPHYCSQLTDSLETYGIPSSINQSNVAIKYDKCDITVYLNGTNTTSQLWKMPCVNGYEYDIAGETLVSEWNLVCDRASLSELTQTFIGAGQCVGAVLFSSMADRYGRKPILLFTNFALFLVGVVTFFVPSYTLFAITRLLLGALQQGVSIVLSTIMLELYPKEHRGTIGALLSVFWTIGIVSLTAFGYGLRNYSWRYVQLAVALVLSHSLVGYWFVDESLRWLLANKKTDEATKLVKKIAKRNKLNVNTVLPLLISAQEMTASLIPTPLPLNEDMPITSDPATEGIPSDNDKITDGETSCSGKMTEGLLPVEEVCEFQDTEVIIEREDMLESPVTDSMPSVVQQYTLLDILKNKILLRNSTILWFAWCVSSLTYYGLFLTSSSLAGNRFINYLINALVEFPSNVLFWLLVNRIPRKHLVVCFHAIAGISMIISVALLTVKDKAGTGLIVSTVFSFLAKLGISSSFNAVWLYTPELYPTNMRSVGFGVASTMARVGAMLAPFSSLLAARVIWGPGVVFGVCCMVVTVLVTLLPETGNRELPQTLEELINWNKESSGWKLTSFLKKKDAIDLKDAKKACCEK